MTRRCLIPDASVSSFSLSLSCSLSLLRARVLSLSNPPVQSPPTPGSLSLLPSSAPTSTPPGAVGKGVMRMSCRRVSTAVRMSCRRMSENELQENEFLLTLIGLF